MNHPSYQIEHTLVDGAGSIAWSGIITFDPKEKKLHTKTLHQNQDVGHTDRSAISLHRLDLGRSVFRIELDGDQHRDVESSGAMEKLYQALLAPSLSATYRPQAWVNDYAVAAGDSVEFDAFKALFKGTQHDLAELHVQADFLAQDLPEHKDHDGPFEVDIDFDECAMVVAAWSGDFYNHWNSNAFDIDALHEAKSNLDLVHPHLLTLGEKAQVEVDDVRPGYAKVRLVLDVEYQLVPGITAQDMVNTLQANLAHAVGNGLLTGPHHEVEVQSHSIEGEVEAQGPQAQAFPSESPGA